MNNISITPKGGTIASEISGDQVNLTAPSVVKLQLNQAEIKSFTRNGNDLVVTTKSGDVLVIHNFYNPQGDSDLVLQDDRGALWWVEDPGTEGFQYVSIDSTEGLLAVNTTDTGTITAFGIAGAALAGIGALVAGNRGGGGGGGDNTGGDTGGGNTGGGNTGGGETGGGTPGGGNTGEGDGSGTGNDTTPPAAVADLALTGTGNQPGAIAQGGTTSDNVPVLSGTAEAGSIISVYDGSTLLGTTTAGADGSWLFTTPVLGDGQHSLSVTVTDAAGNTSAASNAISFTVDTVAPAAATDLAMSGTDNGSTAPLPNGAGTSDTTPTLSGLGEAGTVVSVFDGQTLLGSTVVASDGTWSFTTPVLGSGSHSLSVTLTDAAGNVSAASSAYNIFIQSALPPASGSLEVYDDSGTTAQLLNNGSSTADNTPVLTGVATAGNLITLYNGTEVLGSVVADANGQWRFTPATLADGSYAFSAAVTDANGNVTQTPTITLNIDTLAPASAGELNLSNDTGGGSVPVSAGGVTNTATPTLSGTAEPGSTVSVRDGDTLLGTATADASGNWRFTTPALDEGSHSLTTTVSDAAGNISPASDPLPFTVDATPPAAASDIVLNGTSGSVQQPIAADGATRDITPQLSGSAEPGSVVTVLDNNAVLGSVTAGSDGSWTFITPELNEGAHSLTTTVTDAAGNTGPASAALGFTVDTTPPAAASNLLLSNDAGATPVPVAPGTTTDDSTPVLSGQAEPAAIVNVYDAGTLLGSVTAGSDGSWQFTSPALANGAHSFSVTVTDAAGNTSASSAPVDFSVDASLPPATLPLQVTDDSNGTVVTLADGAITQDDTPILSGVTNAGAIVTLYDGSNVLGSVTADGNGQWSYAPGALIDGTYAFQASIDINGSVTQSDVVTITIDTVAPAVPGDLALVNDEGATPLPVAANGTTGDITPVLSGSAEPGSIVVIRDGDTVLGSVTTDNTGRWSFTTPALAAGDHSLTATATDAAGNSSAASAPYSFTVDTVPPAAASDLLLSSDNSGAQIPLATDGSTNDTTPVLSGTAEAGSVVTISDNGQVLGSSTVGSDGTWRFTTPDLAEGAHSLTATVTDAAGNSSAPSAPVTVTIDTTAPAAVSDLLVTDAVGNQQGPLSNGDTTDDRTPVLSGTSEANATISVYDGSLLLGITSADAAGNWRFTPPTLSNGSHAFTVTATDAAGNVSAPTPVFTVIVAADLPPASGSLEVTSDSGTTTVVLTNGSYTSDENPVLTGLASAGSTIQILDGDTVVGSTTADANGQWTFALFNLSQGPHTLHGVIADASGNSINTAFITITVDSVAPDTAGNLLLASDAGSTLSAVAPGSSTSDNTPVLSGNAEAGSLVTVLDGTTVLGSVTAGTDGSWRFTSPLLSEGGHSFTTTVTDLAGNVSAASAAIDFTVDSVAPAAAGGLALSDANGSAIGAGTTTTDSTPDLIGSAEPGAVVRVYDGTTLLGSVAADEAGNWRFTPAALTNGAHSFTTTVTDAAGNVSAASPAYGFTVAADVPPAIGSLEIVDDSGSTQVPLSEGSSTRDNTPVFSGVAGAGDLVILYNGTVALGSVVADGNGQWNLTPGTLEDGLYAFHATAISADGVQTDSGVINVTIDTAVPDAPAVIDLTDASGAPLDGTTPTNTTAPILSGSGLAAGNIVTVLDGTTVLGSTTVDSDGNWRFTTPVLSDGDHSLTTTVTNAAGNTGPSSAPVTLTVDTLPPAAAANVQLTNADGDTLPANGVTNSTTPTLSGSAEPGSVITVADGGTVIGSASTDSAGNWRFTPDTPLSDGAHSMTTVVTDAAGNSGPASAPLIVTVDTTPPAAASALQLSDNQSGTPVVISNGVTNDTTPVLNGRAEPGSTVTVSDNGQAIGTVVTGNDGNWSFTTPVLSAGDHSLTTTVTDAAGNTGPASDALTFTVDTSVPPVPGDVLLSNNNGETPLPVASGAATNDNTPELSGTAPAGSLVTVYDGADALGSVAADADGNWRFTPGTALADGPHTLTATVTSAAGNTSQPSAPIGVVVDTVPPAAADNLQLSNNNGQAPVAIEPAGVTSDTTPLFSGTAEAGSVVTILDNGSAIGSATADGEGIWRFTPDTPLQAGGHSLSTIVTDSAGNAGSESGAFPFTVDLTAPPAAGNLVLSDDQSGSSVPVTGGATSDTTPVLSGTAAAGSVITILDGDTVLGSVAAGGDGTWSFTTPALTQGDHSLTTTVTSAAGNVSAPSPAISFVVDTQAPDAPAGLQLNSGSGPIADGGATNDPTPVLSGTAEASSTVTLYEDGTVLGTAVTDNDGNWSVTPDTPLAEGSHTLTTTVTDAAGNVSAPSSAVVVIVDTTAPGTPANLQLSGEVNGAAVAIAEGGATTDTTPRLTGSAEPGSVVRVFDNGGELGSASVDGNGNWTFTPAAPLAEGQHSFTTTVTDPAGNAGSASLPYAFTVDLTAPAAIGDLTATDDASQPVTDATTDSTPTLSGSAEPGSLVTLYDGNTAIGSVVASAGDGSWRFVPATPLAEGAHALSATATDAAGNVSAAGNVLALTVDTTAPVLTPFVVSSNNGPAPVTVPDNGFTNDPTPALSGTVEAGSLVTIYDGDTVLGSAVADASSGAWSFTPSALAESSHALSITVADTLGNVSARSDAVTITVDTVPPAAVTALTVNSNEDGTLVPVAADGATRDTTPELTGQADAGSIIIIQNGDVVLGSVVADSSGAWSFTPAALDQGTYTLTATARDAAGNVSDDRSVSFTVDTVAPGTATGLELRNDNEGVIAPGSTIADSSPHLVGSAEANSIITIFDGITPLGTVLADADGNWRYDPLLNDGTWNFNVTVTDAAGNTSAASSVVNVVIDTVVPAPVTNLALQNTSSNTPIADGALTNDSTPAVSGAAEAGTTVTVTDESGNVLGSVLVGSNGLWSLTSNTLSDGQHSLSVTSADSAGNVSAPVTIGLVVDSTPPAVAITALTNDSNGEEISAGSITGDATPVLSGTAEAGSTVFIRSDGNVIGSVVTGGNGQWSFSVPTLSSATHTLSVTASDAAGNSAAAATDITFTVDAVPPAVATFAVFDNSGANDTAINFNAFTRDNTPLISGSAEANSTVSVYNNGVLLGTVQANADGAWSLVSPQLSDGQHSLTVTVTDEIGNVSDVSAAYVIQVDATAPEPVTALLVQNDNDPDAPVTLSSGSVTNDPSPLLSGQAEAGSIVTIYDGATTGTPLGSVRTDADGNWSFTTPALSNTAHTLNVTVTDEAGNISATTPFNLTVNTVNPDPVLSFGVFSNANATAYQVTNGFTNDSTPVLRGTGVAGTTINLIQNGDIVATTTVNEDGIWRYESAQLPDATYAFSVSVTDAAGNVSTETGPISVTVDTVAPAGIALSGLQVSNDDGALAADATSADNTLTLAGTAATGEQVALYDGGTLIATTTATGSGWTFTTQPLSNGGHSFTVVVTDLAGNVGAASDAFAVNVQAPLPPTNSTLEVLDDSGSSLVTLADGAVTRDATPVVRGQATAGELITVLANEVAVGSAVVGSDGQWSVTPAGLSEGANVITYTVNGGAASAPFTLTVDTTAPAVALDLVANNNSSGSNVPIDLNGITNDSTPAITGTAEANSLVTVYEGNTVLGSVTASATGAWSFQSPVLSQGAHALSATVTDAAGNVSARSATVTFTVDTVAPAASTLVVSNDQGTPIVSNGVTSDNTPLLTGASEPGSLITLFDGSVAIGSVVADASGNWRFTPGTPLDEGNHVLRAQVTDTAGNAGAFSSASVITVDSVAPAQPVNLAATNNNGNVATAIGAGNTTNDNTPVISGSGAEPGSRITLSENGTVLGSVTVGSSGQWSITSSVLADGAHTLSVTATDAAGNVSAPATLAFSVATAAPAPVTDLAISDNVSPVTGNLSDNAFTNDTTPTLSGTATAAGYIVSVYDGSTLLGSVVAGSGGAWEFTPAALSNGAHPLSVTVTDTFGNVSAATTPVTLNVDTVAPAASTLAITNDITGALVPNGGSTSDNTPTLSGTAEAGSLVTVSVDGGAVASFTVQQSGAWSYTSAALNDGVHPVSVTVTDPAGNVSAASTATVVVDTAAPAITLGAFNNNGPTLVAVANGGSTSDTTPVLRGTAEAGSLVTISQNGTAIGSVVTGSSGNWSYTTSALAEGSYSFSVTAQDAAGNISAPLTTSLIVDTTAPASAPNLIVTNDVTGAVVPTGGATSDTTPTLSGTGVEAGDIVTVYDGNTVLGTALAGGTGAWSFVSPVLANGTHALSVTVTDAAGNVSARSAAATVVVDTVAPAASTLVVTNDVTGTVVPNGGTTNDTTPTLSGTAEAGSLVTIRDSNSGQVASLTVGGSGNWTYTTAALQPGSHPLSVTVTDPAGNVSAATTATVIIDTTPPAITLAAANNNGTTPVPIVAGGVTSDSTPALSGVTEAGSLVTISDGTAVLGSVVAGSNGAWSYTVPARADGAHTFNVTATDAAGNVSAPVSLSLTVDTTPPATPAIAVIDNVGSIQGALTSGAVTDDNTPTLSGTTEAGGIVTVYDGSAVLGSVVADAGGAWSFTTAALSNGPHTLSVTVRDAVGNVSAPSPAVAITVDTVAPATSTLVITNDVTSTVVPAGGVSSDTTPTLSGLAEAGSRISVYDNGTLIGSTLAAGNGTWSYTTGVLSQGSHPLSVTVTDVAGNVSGTTSATVVIDSVAPTAVTNLQAANNNGSTAVTIPNNGLTNDTTPLLTGSGEVGARVTVSENGTVLGTAIVGSNGNWSFITPVLGNGSHTLSVTQTDAGGNTSPAVSTTLRIDNVAPAATAFTLTDDSGTTPVTVSNGGFTRDTTPTLSGTTEAGAIVTIFDGSTALGTVTADSNGAWSFTTGVLANGAHTLSTTVTDAAGNVSTGNSSATINIDTVVPTAVTGLSINSAGTLVSGSGEANATVSVRDASGNLLGSATVGSSGSWSVNLSTAQTTGATLTVTQADRAGNVSPGASLTGAIRVVATSDISEVDYSTSQATVSNGTVNSSHTALLTVGLGTVLNASVINNGNAYLFTVGPDDTRTVTLNGSVTSVGVAANYSLNLYEQQANGSWVLVSSQANYINALLTIGTLKGANVTYSGLGTGTYAVVVAANTNISVLPTTTVSTVSDYTTLAVTVAATVTGNLLTNDTSSVAGTIPAGTSVTAVGSSAVAASGNTVINTTWGTLTIDAKGAYTYALKAGLNIDTLPAADTFTYSVRDASGAVTSATLTVNLHNGPAATLFAVSSLAVESSDTAHDASGTVWADASASHSGTLIITNELGDSTTVSKLGTTAVAGEFGTLHVAANGSYTYNLNADVNVQNITHKEVFSYTLAGNDGSLTSHSFTIELHPTITGTSGADALTSSVYDDTITSGAGADTLVYHLLSAADSTGGNGHDTWTDFNVAQGDKIDISDLLIGWNDSTSNINDFVKVDHTSDGNTVLSIDRDGSGNAWSSTQLITLEGVNVSLEELLQQPHQNHTA